jgi:cytoskeletal protein RodZ
MDIGNVHVLETIEMGLYKKTKSVIVRPIFWLIVAILFFAGLGWWIWQNREAVKDWFKRQLPKKDETAGSKTEATVDATVTPTSGSGSDSSATSTEAESRLDVERM